MKVRGTMVRDQYLLRRRDDSLELWQTDGLGVSWCAARWPLGASVGHHFHTHNAWTLVQDVFSGMPTVIPGHAPEVHEDGRCDCRHGCRWGR